MGKFIFFSEKVEPVNYINYKIVIVDKNIRKKEELFNFFTSQLHFPSYFGKNWDAFYDCLTDLSWIIEREIIVVHEDVPFDTIKEKKIYIDILSDLIINWEENNELHSMHIYFPQKFEEEIKLLLRN